jgi:hypothetical protein
MCLLGRAEVSRRILAYLTDNPDAQDTLPGIVEWWMLDQEIKAQTTVVKEGLADLVARELIIGRTGEDSQTHYRINYHKLKEVAWIVREEVRE